MEYIRGTKAPVEVAEEDPDEVIQVPYLGDVGDVRTRPQPSTGYARAEWYAKNTAGGMSRNVSAGATLVSSGKKNAVGTNMRGVNGAAADEYTTDSFWTGYNVVNNPEQYTMQAGDVGNIWDAQVQASKGLNYLTWDQAYVDQDSQSVWM